MPVSTQLIREGEAMPLRWGAWHLHCLASAVRSEDPDFDLYCGFPNAGRYEFTEAHCFLDESDGEVLILLPGDIWTAYR